MIGEARESGVRSTSSATFVHVLILLDVEIAIFLISLEHLVKGLDTRSDVACTTVLMRYVLLRYIHQGKAGGVAKGRAVDPHVDIVLHFEFLVEPYLER